MSIGRSCLSVGSKFIHLGIEENSHARKLRCHLLQHGKPFAGNSLLVERVPVRFPPGRAKLATRPPPIGSITPTNTIGIARVFLCNAAATTEDGATITSG